LKVIFESLLMSVKVTGEEALGPGAGGVRGPSPPLYDRPVRAGVGEGVGAGCCARIDLALRQATTIVEKSKIRPADFSVEIIACCNANC